MDDLMTAPSPQRGCQGCGISLDRHTGPQPGRGQHPYQTPTTPRTDAAKEIRP